MEKNYDGAVVVKSTYDDMDMNLRLYLMTRDGRPLVIEIGVWDTLSAYERKPHSEEEAFFNTGRWG